MIPKSERRWLAGFILVTVVITSIPYFAGFMQAGQGWRFSGFFFGVDDGNSYVAKMLSGEAGAWLFRTPYTALPQTGILAFLPYILIGKLAYPPGLHDQLVALFHIFRGFSICLFVIASYKFLGMFIQEVRFRRLGVILISFGGGLGWVLLAFGLLPLEFFSPESFGFLSLLGLPHLAAARAFLLWGLIAYLKVGQQDGSSPAPRKAGVSTGLLWLALGLFQPLTVAIGWFLLGMHVSITWLWRFWKRSEQTAEDWSKWKNSLSAAVWAILISSPIVIYTTLSFATDPFLIVWESQNLILSPNILFYLAAYGLMLPFAVFGARRLLHYSRDAGLFFAGWLVSLPILAYAPYNLQRRLPEGIWTAWVLLAMIWLATCSDGKRDKWQYVFYPSFLSTLIFLIGGFLQIEKLQSPVYVPADEAKLFETIQEKVPVNSLFLTSFTTGNQLPAWAPVRVMIGHGPESANLKEIQPLVNQFYGDRESDQARLELIQRYRVRYIFWGPSERELGGWDLSRAAFLRQIDRVGEYSFYEVIR